MNYNWGWYVQGKDRVQRIGDDTRSGRFSRTPNPDDYDDARLGYDDVERWQETLMRRSQLEFLGMGQMKRRISPYKQTSLGVDIPMLRDFPRRDLEFSLLLDLCIRNRDVTSHKVCDIIPF